nr:biopolymer transporter ExbD [Jannaschia sp. Os4]
MADAMFQLLIFFMLASSQVPYSLLTLKPGTPAGAAAAAPSEAPAPVGETALWSIDSGAVVAGGQRFGFDALPDLAGALVAAGTERVVLVARPTARVQDLVAVAEALTGAGIPSVAVTRAGAP